MDFRVTVILDYSVPDGTDEDEFHDLLRRQLEDGSTELPEDLGMRLESVRDIDVEVLDN